MADQSDEQLLAEHLSGTSGAFDQLVRRYANELYGFLFRFVSNASTADDLVQETFIQVHQAAATFDAGRSFKPWLYTIAANKARDCLRSRSRRQEYSLDAGSDNDDLPAGGQLLEAGGATLDQTAEQNETRAAVRQLIDRMPDHLRMILTLGYFQQLPYAEIAEILEIPVGTVKSRLHAAVQHFADLWKRHGIAADPRAGR